MDHIYCTPVGSFLFPVPGNRRETKGETGDWAWSGQSVASVIGSERERISRVRTLDLGIFRQGDNA